MAPMFQALVVALLASAAPSPLRQHLPISLDLAQLSLVLQTPPEATFQPDAHAMLATAGPLPLLQRPLSSLDLVQLLRAL